MPEHDALTEVLKAQIVTQDFYIKSLAGGIAAMGVFFGWRWLAGITENTRASTDQAASNRELAKAVEGLTKVVLDDREG